MRLSMIVNPAASSVSRRSLVVIKKVLGAEHELVVHETTRPRQATRLAHRAMKDGVDVVVTVGGDGTVNEAANGLLGGECAVAPLPGGSTNVFARAIGYPNDAEAATTVLLEALAADSIIRGSVGMANDRAFLFHVGIGFDAAVVTRVEQRSPLKRYAGHPWFVASALAAWASPERRQLAFAVAIDDGRGVDRTQMAVALNVNPYTFIGSRPFDLAPEADLTTPLSIVALDSLGPRGILPAAKAALSGLPDGLPDRGTMHHWPKVEGATITGTTAFPYQLDGEPQEPVTELRLEHRPAVLPVVVPA